MTTMQLVLVALIPLVLWRIYSRVRRFVGRQRSRLWRHWLAALFFPIAIALFSFLALHDPVAFASLAAGAAVGAGLAVWALRLTTYECNLTLLVFGLLAGYYAVHGAGLLRWRLTAPAEAPPARAA